MDAQYDRKTRRNSAKLSFFRNGPVGTGSAPGRGRKERMMDYTRFTNVEVTGDLKMSGSAVMPAATKTKAGAVKMAAKVA